MQCIIRHDGSWSTRVSQPVIRLHSKNLCLWNHMPYKSVPKKYEPRDMDPLLYGMKDCRSRSRLQESSFTKREKRKVFTLCDGMKESTCLKDTGPLFTHRFGKRHGKRLVAWGWPYWWCGSKQNERRRVFGCYPFSQTEEANLNLHHMKCFLWEHFFLQIVHVFFWLHASRKFRRWTHRCSFVGAFFAVHTYKVGSQRWEWLKEDGGR